MRKGCSASKGNEIETTLLLSPKAIVKAAPIILCGEEDISAEHGSTIGKLSNEMLFYMNSRGIDQKTAEDLLTRAKITAAAAGIRSGAVSVSRTVHPADRSKLHHPRPCRSSCTTVTKLAITTM